MTEFRKWCTPTVLVVCLALNAIQAAVRVGSHTRSTSRNAPSRKRNSNQVKNLEPIIRNQRYELNRYRLQIKAIGNIIALAPDRSLRAMNGSGGLPIALIWRRYRFNS